MKAEQINWTKSTGWTSGKRKIPEDTVHLILVFGSPGLLNEREPLDEIREKHPQAHILGCSTAGEIRDTEVSDDSLVATMVHFEHTRLRTAKINLKTAGANSYNAGRQLAIELQKKDLVHIFTLSDGTTVNGSELAKGFTHNLPEKISVTGGLAGDGNRFGQTYVLCDDTKPETNCISALGFYSDRLQIGYGSVGGWDPFGLERRITSSKANVLYELDGRSALELYKKYLGEHACNLPASGLLFPLSIRSEQNKAPVVRTILGVNEKEQSLTFAGDVPEGSYARLMKANLDRLVDGAMEAARKSCDILKGNPVDLAILISCVGRKLVFHQRIEEEVEGVREVLGNQTTITGFYSYGELCPSSYGSNCDLHNQTMTITAFLEK